MASTDSVAIDTVETTFAGYEISSIRMLEAASKNGIGQGNPAHIMLQNQELFTLHRILLLEQYGKNQRYPLESGWGGSKVIPELKPQYMVDASLPEKVRDGVSISYRILPQRQCIQIDSFTYCSPSSSSSRRKRPIVRTDCYVNGERVDSKTGSNIESGNFTVCLSQYPHFRNSSLVLQIFAWDDIFNCVPSLERFIITIEQ